MKIINIKEKLEEKLEELALQWDLTPEQKTEFRLLIEQAGKLKTGALLIEHKTFRDYIGELLTYKFLFKKVKVTEVQEEIKTFILDFFVLMFPSVNRDNISITVETTEVGAINIIEHTELTKTLFDTIINTNIK